MYRNTVETVAGDDTGLVGRAHVSYPGPTDDGPGVELAHVAARLVVRQASPKGRPTGPALVDRALAVEADLEPGQPHAYRVAPASLTSADWAAIRGPGLAPRYVCEVEARETSPTGQVMVRTLAQVALLPTPDAAR